MNERELLESKGYDVQVKNLAICWVCTLEWNNQIKAFPGVTEAEAIHRAAQFVAGLEDGYMMQLERLRCEGCGD